LDETRRRLLAWVAGAFAWVLPAVISPSYLVLLLGLLVQVLLLFLAGELLDLYVSAVELWEVLARKHLEIVLDSTP